MSTSTTLCMSKNVCSVLYSLLLPTQVYATHQNKHNKIYGMSGWETVYIHTLSLQETGNRFCRRNRGKVALAWKNMFCKVPEIAESTRLYGLYLFFLSCGMHGVISCFVASHQALRTQSRQLLLQWNIIQQVMLTQYTCFSGSLGPNMSENIVTAQSQDGIGAP